VLVVQREISDVTQRREWRNAFCPHILALITMFSIDFFFWFFFRNEGWLPASPKIGIILIFGVSSSQFITLNKKKRETQNQEKEKKIKLFLFSCDKTEI
jgi:hypothetical protein